MAAGGWAANFPVMLSGFAPYAFHVARAWLSFYLAVANEVVGPRPSNRIDLEYLFYLPFTQVFASGDRLHERLAQPLMRDDQNFVTTETLKSDLHQISNWRGALTDEERARVAKERGSYPPPIGGSFTLRVWEQYAGPWTPRFARPSLTEEEQQRVIMEIQGFMESLRPDDG